MNRAVLAPVSVLAASLMATTVLAGCFSVSFDDGDVACSTSQLCPVGLSCQEGVCRLPGASRDAASDSSAVDAPIGIIASSCAAHLASGQTASGVYTIDPAPLGDPTPVYCEMTIDGGGWTVLAHNESSDDEPEGCRPRLATSTSLACGSPDPAEDFATPTTTIEFRELLFAAYDTGIADVTSYRWFRWDAPVTFPPSEQWELVPDSSDDAIDGLSTLPLITCRFGPIGASGLRRVLNGTPRIDTGSYLATDVVTLFDQDLVTDNPGKLGFSDASAVTGSLSGLDDFQDGNGCQDAWDPQADRGRSAFIAVR